MLGLEVWVGGAILVSLVFYALSGGADFGGGVWDLLASGPRAQAQRKAIAQALAPIWEANHVWLIVVVVVLFVAFPPAFGAISIALHVPLTLMLLGIVLRGTAFVFRTYDVQEEVVQRRWSRLFAVSSAVTPVMLGVTVGAVCSGRIAVDVESGRVDTDFVSAWLAPFPFALGFFTLSLFAFLAAVYLTCEVDDWSLREDFRQRALVAGLVAGGLAWLCFFLSARGAPLVHRGLSEAWWSLPFQGLTAAVALGALFVLWKRRYGLARLLAATQVGLVVAGWGAAQYPFLVVPDLTLANSASPVAVLRPLLVTLVVGAVLIGPAFWYLYATFKGNKGRG